MPKVAIGAVVLALVWLGQLAWAQDAAQAPILWNKHHFRGEEPLRVSSPTLGLMAVYNGTERLAFFLDGALAGEQRILPPASILWSGSRNYFAINNGDGSGQFNNLKVVQRHGTRLVASSDAELRLREAFVERSQCSVDPNMVSVRAEGWSLENPHLWVSFEVWDRENRCEHEGVYFARLDIRDNRVLEILSRRATFNRFCFDPGFRRLFERDCTRDLVQR